MATVTLSQTQHIPQTATGITKDPEATVNGTASGALSTLDALRSNVGTWARDILDRFFPPEQREALLAKIKALILANPKVSVGLNADVGFQSLTCSAFRHSWA